MESSFAIRRAISGLGKKTVYSSPGRGLKFAAEAFPEGIKLDCSGFIYWCLRFASPVAESRMVDHPLYKKVNGGWFETTAIHRDGKESTGYFREIEPVVGSLLVYPDYRGADNRPHDGHIGIVTQIDPSKKGLARVRKIIHCSLGGWRNHGDAIRETGPELWTARSSSIPHVRTRCRSPGNQIEVRPANASVRPSMMLAIATTAAPVEGAVAIPWAVAAPAGRQPALHPADCSADAARSPPTPHPTTRTISPRSSPLNRDPLNQHTRAKSSR